MRRAKATDRAKSPRCSAGLLRGTGSGTVGRSVAGQERPSREALEWASRAYKAEPKAPGARRESEGSIVPETARRVEPRAGKGPCLDRAPQGGKGEGMARANFPCAMNAVSCEEKVRELQRGLYTAAKRSGGRKFHALYDRLSSWPVLCQGRFAIRGPCMPREEDPWEAV